MSMCTENVVPSAADAGPVAWNDWMWQMANCARVSAPGAEWKAGSGVYPASVTPYYYSLAASIDLSDPIAAQFLFDARELATTDSDDDPLCELQYHRAGRLIHRYSCRAVLLATEECSVRCRHCTRRNTLGKLAGVGEGALEDAYAYIRSHAEIREVLVSGGDPLCLPDERLFSILRELKSIDHVRVLRLGTRMPVVLPMRITDELCNGLTEFAPLWLNTQFNHPSELTDEAHAACARLTAAGIPVSNQTVLLKGINDDLSILKDLCNGLHEMMVRPYYVFLCDRIKGTEHFWTTKEEARALSRNLRHELSGMACPMFVADVPGSSAKIPL